MKKYLLFIVLLCIVTASVQAQPNHARDTSFTVYSAYIKTLKNYPQIRIVDSKLPKNVKATMDITYCNIGNRALKADIFYPATKTKKKRPAVLLIHGGGWRSGDRSQQIPMAQHLAAKGFVSITAEYRLSTEALYPAAIFDLKAAVRWIKANAKAYQIDTNKVVVLGCSAGGQLAALIGTTNNNPEFEDKVCNPDYSSNVAAIVDVDGTLAFIHPESEEGNDKPGKPSAATLWLGKSAAEDPLLWKKVAPLNHVSSNTPPILFLNSGVTRMHAGRNDMIQKLDSLHIYSEVHTFEDAPHPFWLFHPWFNPMMQYIVTFLNRISPNN
jgi:acetyl esterase/lipase